jgi:hypothetical protein
MSAYFVPMDWKSDDVDIFGLKVQPLFESVHVSCFHRYVSADWHIISALQLDLRSPIALDANLTTIL